MKQPFILNGKLLIGVLLVFASCSQSGEKSEQRLYPFALSEPTEKPMVFSEGTITTTNGIYFSRDGFTLFISNPIDKQFDSGKKFAGIFKSIYRNGKWTTPEPLELEMDAYHPVLSYDNRWLYFNSRSHPDSVGNEIPHNIWRVDPSDLSNPELVATVNSSGYESYPSLAKNNNLYFNSNRIGGKGGMDIYVSKFIDGNYSEPVNLEVLNSGEEENDLVVDPEEKFIIFNRYVHSTNEIDLFISYNEQGEWSLPKTVDKINASEVWELTPTLSPDGRYFFYEVDNKIMQVDLSAIMD